MKKSRLYQVAQCAVVNHPTLDVPTKLEILRELFDREDIALMLERDEVNNDEAVR
jgi:hypothetical protein